MEYPDWHPSIGNKLLDAFQNYHLNNNDTLYITGNHDHWHLKYLKQVGFDMEDEYRILNIDGLQILIMHGDGLKDSKFRLPRSRFNRLLRSNTFNRIYRKLFPPKIGLKIMKYISTLNRWMESEEKAKQRSILSDWSSQLLDQSDLDAIVCGHNHNTELLTFNDGRYLNPGFYADNNSLGFYTNKQFRLVTWDVSSHKLIPLTSCK
jgi:UDP-2,3-diacylglucosamine pyrophosphatase LpxH